MRGLAKQDLSFRPGRTLITQVLSSGEAPLAVTTIIWFRRRRS